MKKKKKERRKKKERWQALVSSSVFLFREDSHKVLYTEFSIPFYSRNVDTLGVVRMGRRRKR